MKCCFLPDVTLALRRRFGFAKDTNDMAHFTSFIKDRDTVGFNKDFGTVWLQNAFLKSELFVRFYRLLEIFFNVEFVVGVVKVQGRTKDGV